MGSQSDWPTMQEAANVLDDLGIKYEKKIVLIPVLYTVGLQATFWNMDSNVWAILVVWPGKAAVDSLVDRLSKGGKPKFKYFSS